MGSPLKLFPFFILSNLLNDKAHFSRGFNKKRRGIRQKKNWNENQWIKRPDDESWTMDVYSVRQRNSFYNRQSPTPLIWDSKCSNWAVEGWKRSYFYDETHFSAKFVRWPQNDQLTPAYIGQTVTSWGWSRIWTRKKNANFQASFSPPPSRRVQVKLTKTSVDLDDRPYGETKGCCFV